MDAVSIPRILAGLACVSFRLLSRRISGALAVLEDGARKATRGLPGPPAWEAGAAGDRSATESSDKGQ